MRIPEIKRFLQDPKQEKKMMSNFMCNLNNKGFSTEEIDFGVTTDINVLASGMYHPNGQNMPLMIGLEYASYRYLQEKNLYAPAETIPRECSICSVDFTTSWVEIENKWHCEKCAKKFAQNTIVIRQKRKIRETIFKTFLEQHKAANEQYDNKLLAKKRKIEELEELARKEAEIDENPFEMVSAEHDDENEPEPENKSDDEPELENKPDNEPELENKPDNEPELENKPDNEPELENKPDNEPELENKPDDEPEFGNKPDEPAEKISSEQDSTEDKMEVEQPENLESEKIENSESDKIENSESNKTESSESNEIKKPEIEPKSPVEPEVDSLENSEENLEAEVESAENSIKNIEAEVENIEPDVESLEKSTDNIEPEVGETDPQDQMEEGSSILDSLEKSPEITSIE